MIVGVCQLDLHISAADSLKAKRMVLNRIKDKVQNKFNVSIAEVDAQESWQRAVLGIAAVSTSTRHADSTLTNVINFIERDGWCEITHIVKEII